MWNRLAKWCVLSVAILFLFSVPLTCSAITPTSAGSLQLTITASYASFTVHGEIENAVIYPNNSVSMMFTINDKVLVHGYSSQIMMNGTLDGMRTGSSLAGPMSLVGEFCIQVCADVGYVGKGQWSGALNQTGGSGTIQGMITVTKSSFEFVAVGATSTFKGTWSADFQPPPA